MALINKINKNSKGQSIVELALVLPLILFLIMGMIDFGRIMNAYLITNQASREGVRQAAVGKTDTEIIYAVNHTAASLDSSILSILIEPHESLRHRGTETQVAITYEVEIITPMMSQIISNPFVIETSTRMRVE